MKIMRNSELIIFCSQFSLILHSGISALEGLSLMTEDTPPGEGRQILEHVTREMEATGNLAASLRSAGVFPDYLCSMVEIGELSGRLDTVMDSLAAYYQREEDLRNNLKSAVAYPLVMIGMMILVMVILLVNVLPVFQQVFLQLGTGMTGISRTLLNLGYTLRRCSMLFLVLAILAAFAFFFFAFTERGRKMIRGFSRRFILTRSLARKVACSRFARGMHLCLGSGLELSQSLEMTEALIDHPQIRGQIARMRQIIEEGGTFSEAASQTGLFSGIYTRMLTIGSRTGASDEVLQQISDRYDEEISDQISRTLSRLEPTLVAILSIVVGMILLSVMFPLIGIMSNIG